MIAQTQVPQPVDQKVRNLVELFHERVRTSTTQRAAMYKVGSTWKDMSWSELGRRVKELSNGLIARGVQPGDRVALFGATRLEWCIADFAIIAAGAITVPIYASNTAEECQFIIENAGCKIVVVDGDYGERGAPGRLTRIIQVREKVSTVGTIITFDKDAATGKTNVVGMEDVEAEGVKYAADHPGDYDARVGAIKPEQPACFIYTSGTTGNPKGVVLTHRGWVYEAQCVGETGLMRPDEVVLLFLPMAHSFGKVVQAAWLGLGFNMAFCDNVDKLLEYASEVKPTVLPAVPRIFEKVYAGVIQKATTQPGIKGKLATWAMKEFDQYATARTEGKEYSSLGFSLAKALVFKKVGEQVKQRVGGRIRLFVSGSAPLAKKIAYFFELNDILILEGYGLTETSAGTCVNRPTKNKIGTVGPCFPGSELKIAEDGEVLIKGPAVMTGYFNNDEATKDAFTADGWFKTGDIGELDADGYLKITDRKKDLIKTSGGKYIAPQNLENALKTSPIISQVMVHGDRRKYVSALVTISEDVGKKLLQEKGVSYTSYEAMTKRDEVAAEVKKAFDALNATLPSYETIKRWAILDKDLTLESGDLTPTLKVKRKIVTQKYMEVLNGLYDGERLD
jgi:long-chain acyl-CoA synthetase